MLKDLIKFVKFKYGKVVMVPCWVGQSPSQGMFPKKTLSRPCSEYEVDEGITFGHGDLNISRAHIVSFMCSFMEGVLCPSFENATFFQALYLPFIFYGLNIKCYMQCVTYPATQDRPHHTKLSHYQL
jgi:hypothetical protein